jgi:HK97 family phage prohead protease
MSGFGFMPENGKDVSGTITGLECTFMRFEDVAEVEDGVEISGYASLFGAVDQGGDVVEAGAYAASLKAMIAAKRSIKMLWQHQPGHPIGVWDEVREDARGLWVKGRILNSVEKGREAAALIAAGAIDGLSIGYRTVKATKNSKGQRLLSELELWEVSLVTFPMLPSARVGAKGDFIPVAEVLREMAAAFEGARAEMGRG